MTVELISYDRETDEFKRFGIVRDGELIEITDDWEASESFATQLEAWDLLSDEEELVRTLDNPWLQARKIEDPDLDGQ